MFLSTRGTARSVPCLTRRRSHSALANLLGFPAAPASITRMNSPGRNPFMTAVTLCPAARRPFKTNLHAGAPRFTAVWVLVAYACALRVNTAVSHAACVVYAMRPATLDMMTASDICITMPSCRGGAGPSRRCRGSAASCVHHDCTSSVTRNTAVGAPAGSNASGTGTLLSACCALSAAAAPEVAHAMLCDRAGVYTRVCVRVCICGACVCV